MFGLGRARFYHWETKVLSSFGTLNRMECRFFETKKRYNESVFSRLKLIFPLVKAVEELSFSSPTPIQSEVIPLALEGRNIVASSKTGTGKTAAYGLPLLQKMYHERFPSNLERRKLRLSKEIQANNKKPSTNVGPGALILAPSRDLAEQITSNLVQFMKFLPTNLKICCLHSGGAPLTQIRLLQKQVDILVATPGRLLDLARPKDAGGKHEAINFGDVSIVVLDECDRLFSLGMFPDLREIMRLLPSPAYAKQKQATEIQVMMFSATIVPEIRGLLKRYAPRYTEINLNIELDIPSTINHVLYQVHQRRKPRLLVHLLKLKEYKNQPALVFTSTQHRAEQLSNYLKKHGILSNFIHKKCSSLKRNNALEELKSGKIQVLVATDVLSRGIDLPELSLVVNYDFPHEPSDYVHRVGRTGRMDHSGKAISFVSKTPIVVTIRKRIVEINEQHFAKRVAQFLGHELKQEDVPGGWKDRPIDLEKDANWRRQQKLKEQKIEQLKEKNEAKVPQRNRTIQRHKEKQGDVSLRDFSEGRYEDVVQALDKQAAIKKGVAVADNIRKSLATKTRRKRQKRFKRKIQRTSRRMSE